MFVLDFSSLTAGTVASFARAPGVERPRRRAVAEAEADPVVVLLTPSVITATCGFIVGPLLLAPAQPFERGQRLLVQPVCHPRRPLLGVLDGRHVPEERLG